MRGKNLIIRVSGLILLLLGIGFNINMYLSNAWPTYLFYIISLLGLLLLLLSFLSRSIKKQVQVFIVLIPVVALAALLIVSA